jgi:hypothetical protein
VVQLIFVAVCVCLYLCVFLIDHDQSNVYSLLKFPANQSSSSSLKRSWPSKLIRKQQNRTRLFGYEIPIFDSEIYKNSQQFTAEEWKLWLNETIPQIEDVKMELSPVPDESPTLQNMFCPRWGYYNGTNHPIFAILTTNRPQLLNGTLYHLLCEAGADPSRVLIFPHDNKEIDLDEAREITNRYNLSLVLHNEAASSTAQHKSGEWHQRASNHVFGTLNQSYLVFLEDDLQTSPDVVTFFDGISKIMDFDSSIFCASSWNGYGYPATSGDMYALRRGDYFVGLGYMISRQHYEKKVYPILQDTPGIDWLAAHHKAMKDNRLECIFPEVSRVHHVLESNLSSLATTNWMQKDYFDNMVLSNVFNLSLDFGEVALEPYDDYVENIIFKAPQIRDLSVLPYFRNMTFTYYCASCKRSNLQAWNNIMMSILGPHRTGIMDKPFIYGLYRNTLAIRLYTNYLWIVASDSPYRGSLSDRYAEVTSVQKKAIDYQLFSGTSIGAEGLSCDEVCAALNQPGVSCREPVLNVLNNCSMLKRFMKTRRKGACTGECIVNREFYFPAVRPLPGVDRTYSCTITYARYVNCREKPPPGYRRLCYCE